MYVLRIYILKLIKQNAAKVFMFVKRKCKMWLMFLQAKQQQQMSIRRLWSLKTIKQGNVDVFL